MIEKDCQMRRRSLKNFAEGIALFACHLRHPGKMALRKHHRLERPDRPEGTSVTKCSFSMTMRSFADVRAQRSRRASMIHSLLCDTLRFLFRGHEMRNSCSCPNLAVRMRVARAHDRAAIFKNLHVADFFPPPSS